MKRLGLIVFIYLMIVGCSSTGEGYMQANDLLTEINKGNAPVVIDVRSSSEYQTSHVPSAIHIPFWQALTTDKLEQVDQAKPVVLYCEHGPRAGFAKLALFLSGFEKIQYLSGHMQAWKKSGLPVEIGLND